MTAAAPPLSLLHTREEFSFIARAPLEVAWPLFGADGERAWAPGWDPQFLWPTKAADQEGMVFTVDQAEHTAVWINTAFDRASNKIQYVYVIAGLVATVISLRLAASGDSTHVAVIYERTALGESANDLVRNMAEHDKAAGKEWRRQIDAHLRSRCSVLEGVARQ
jgi:hypothetical protein